MPPGRQGGLLQEGKARAILLQPSFNMSFDSGWTLALLLRCAVYSEVCWPKLQKAGGTRPGRCGGRVVFGRSFVSFPFRAALGGRWG